MAMLFNSKARKSHRWVGELAHALPRSLILLPRLYAGNTVAPTTPILTPINGSFEME